MYCRCISVKFCRFPIESAHIFYIEIEKMYLDILSKIRCDFEVSAGSLVDGAYITIARYISGLIMKMRIFIIKNGFIVFQSIQTTCRSTFSTKIETPPKHGF